VDVLGAKAAFVGVGRSTAAKVEAAKKRNPEAVARIAKGDTTANKELGKTKGKARASAKPPGASKSRRPDKGTDKNVGQRTKEPEVRAGGRIYEVGCYSPLVAGSPRIIEHEILKVDTLSYACADGTRLHKVEAFSLEGAKAQRNKLIEEAIGHLKAGIKDLEKELKQSCPRRRKASGSRSATPRQSPPVILGTRPPAGSVRRGDRHGLGSVGWTVNVEILVQG
jgi:hypothetical protein